MPFPISEVLAENEVQSAIFASLQTYALSRGISAQVYEPYANQQGERMRLFGADLIAILDRARIVMLEVKALDVVENELVRYRADQHAMCCRLEELNLPIAYAYNTRASLPYFHDPQPEGWPRHTLAGIARARPSLLPDHQPAFDHPSLLTWLEREDATNTDKAKELGWLLGASRTRPRALTNAAMLLIHSVPCATLLALPASEADALLDTLARSPVLDASGMSVVQRILGSAAEGFQLFASPDDSASDEARNYPSSPRF